MSPREHFRATVETLTQRHVDDQQARDARTDRRLSAGHHPVCALGYDACTCYGHANESGELRPLSMRAAYGDLSNKARAMMGRRAT